MLTSIWLAASGLVIKYLSVIIIHPELLSRIIFPIALLAFVIFLGYLNFDKIHGICEIAQFCI